MNRNCSVSVETSTSGDCSGQQQSPEKVYTSLSTPSNVDHSFVNEDGIRQQVRHNAPDTGATVVDLSIANTSMEKGEPKLPMFENLGQDASPGNVLPDFFALSSGGSPRSSPRGLFTEFLNPDSPRRAFSACSSRLASPDKVLPPVSAEAVVSVRPNPSDVIAPGVQLNEETAQVGESEEMVGETPVLHDEEVGTSQYDESSDPAIAIQYSDLRLLLEETAELASRRVLDGFFAMQGNPQVVSTTENQEVAGPSTGSVTQAGRKRQGTEILVESGSKRPANRYVLQDWMFRRYPVMRFFVTGPTDCEKTPHKWTCRVCNQELSLMTKGAVEIMTHYRSESHLVREHRVRLETPGLPLFDKHERELLGSELQQAIELAKKTHPIAPVLCEKRPYPGQAASTANEGEATPVAQASAHITLLSRGLMHGGSLTLLTSLWKDLLQESSSPSLSSSQSLSPERAMVSFH